MARRVVLLLACLLAAGCAGAQVPTRSAAQDAQPAPRQDQDDARLAPRVVRAPHYGDALFRFFQDQHFDALTTLMVSQHFQRVAPHDDDAELLRGGLLASYGLHREAGEVFARLLDTGAPQAVRDRAWFELAKIRYRRGQHAEAEQALAHVGSAPAAGLREDRALLDAQLRMARGDYAGAAALLAALPPEASLYARYNLGVALVRSGDLAAGAALLDRIGSQSAADEEERSLRDRANVALGLASLQERQPADARRYLQRVRLQGLAASKALLAFGWAAAELGEPKEALAPWTELAARPLADAAVLEAQIALPYALAELGASVQAQARYEDALGQFDGERRALDQSIAAIAQGRLVDDLLARNPGRGMGGADGVDRLPQRMPHAVHLEALLAGHEFQEAFKNLRDLVFLGNNLGQWTEQLSSFDDMLALRRRAFAERLPRVREQAGAANLPAMQQRRDALAESVLRAERDTDAAAFADARHAALQERVARVAAFLASAPDTPEFGEARERLRRATGALAWEQMQQFPARLWEAKKALGATDAALTEAARRDRALARAADEEPARLERLAARIAAFGPRIAALVPRVAALRAEQQAHLQGLAVAELEGQKERLEVYATQAKLALAQLLDRAQLAQRKPGPAATQEPR